MADIDYWVDEFQNSLSELTTMMTEIRQAASNNSDTKLLINIIKTTEEKLESTKKIQKSCGIELRVLRDKEKRILIEEVVQKMNKNIHEIQKEFNFIKTTTERDNLLGKSTTSLASNMNSGQANPSDPFNMKGKNNDEFLDATNKVQDLTFDSLARTRNMIQESEEIGTATLEQLQAQHDQMKDIEKEVDNLDTNIKRAESLILNFTKRMASDRIIQFFAALNICIIIALIVYAAVTGNTLQEMSKTGGKSGGVPPSSSTSTPTFAPTTASIIPPIAGSPTFFPTYSPTFAPSLEDSPTQFPSLFPTIIPTQSPSQSPSMIPSEVPTLIPTTSRRFLR